MALDQKLLLANWNDLKYFLMLKRHRRLSLAAQRLGSTHVTVANRISALENALGTQLFIQDSKGFRLTKAGEKFALYAEQCERQLALALEDREKDAGTRSKIRVGVTEGLGDYYLSVRMARWAREQNIDVDFISLPKSTSISSREADISITLERPKGEFVIQRILTDYILGIYASPDYLDEYPPITRKEDLLGHLWIGYIESMMFTEALNYHKEISPDLTFSFNSTSIMAQQQAARAASGLSILPGYMAHNDGQLVRVLPRIRFVRRYWISTSRDLHRFHSVRETWKFILRSCKADQAVLNP